MLHFSFSLFAPYFCNFLCLCISLVFVASLLLSLFSLYLSISRVSAIFHVFLVTFLVFLFLPLTLHNVLFLFLSILPSPSVSISHLIAVWGQRYLKPFTVLLRWALGIRDCIRGLWGYPLNSGFACTRNETSFKRRHRQSVQKFLAHLYPKLVRVMKHTRCFKLTR